MKPIMRVEHLTHTYGENTPFCRSAVKDVNMEILEGEFLGIIGHTGSGKSTLIQHLNGLLKPTSGKICLGDRDIWADPKKIRDVRFRVGLVFQYPEHQLFEVDVFTDVCFGPKNQGLSREETETRAREALSQVGIGESYYKKSPFELSGGEKRRVAIAGVLAMEPEVLILDEPTAGLDPRGRDEILGQLARLHKERGMTIILVSHSMEDVAKYVDRIMVMNHGRLVFDDPPRAVFARYKELEEMGLAAPQVTYIAHALKEAGFPMRTDVITVEEAEEAVLRTLGIE